MSLGFRPALLILKKCSGAGSWDMYTDKQDLKNPMEEQLFADENYNLNTISTAKLDLFSCGFKLRTSNTDRNASNQDYIYLAWAAFPMVSAGDIPGVAG